VTTLPHTTVAGFSADGRFVDYVELEPAKRLVHRSLADGKTVAWPIEGDASGVRSMGRWVQLGER
jgi:hypothetical protein